MRSSHKKLSESVLEQIRHKIRENQLTQSQVGAALGVKQSAVSYLLKGKTKISLEQFFALTSLLGEKPQRILASAEEKRIESSHFSEKEEETLFKSFLHLLIYCAAVRPIKYNDLKIDSFHENRLKKAMTDLVKSGLLMKRNGAFIQKNPHIIYHPKSRRARELMEQHHRTIHTHCQKIWAKRTNDSEYKSTRFNYFLVDSFTPSQIKQVEEHFWKAYERLKAFQSENMAKGYGSGEEYRLWQTHLMMMTPLDV